jgi:hypothetical protein
MRTGTSVFAPEEQDVYSLDTLNASRSVRSATDMSLLTERKKRRITVSYKHLAPPEQRLYFEFPQLANIIQLLCVDSLTTCLIEVDRCRRQSFTAKEWILGYSFEQDFCLAQAAPAFRYFSSLNLSFRTLLHQLKGAYRGGRLQ